MKNQAEFINSVVKQGNSLCVRIPCQVSKELNLKEGEEISVSLTCQKNEYKYNEEVIQKLLKISNKIRKLDKFSELKKRFFIMLNFEFLNKTYSKDLKEQKRKQIDFIKEKKKEFNSRIIEEFIEWGTIFNKEVFVKDKEGNEIIKSKYRI
jgi:antitoxin component of MazEF toxin-antitoxin module